MVCPLCLQYMSDRPCSYGRFYTNDTGDGFWRCKTCSVCEQGHQAVRYCDGKRDTECARCSHGTFNEEINGRCRPCRDCKKGEYLKKSCSWNSDTVCGRCRRKTFSHVDNTIMCRPCTKCKRHEVRQYKCSRDNDTVCGDCIFGR